MNRPVIIPPHLQFKASLLILIVTSMQIGVGLLGFQRIIIEVAGNSAWICSILAGIVCSLTIYVMLLTLRKYPSYNLYQIHKAIFGKSLGMMINSVYMLYTSIMPFSILVLYVEVVKTWIFPDIATWIVSAILMALAVYGLYGGIRSVVGTLFLSKGLTMWMTLLLIFPMNYADWNYLLPLFDASPFEIFNGLYHMTYTLLGFELMFFIYPYIADKKNIFKFTNISLLYTTFVYTAVLVVSIVYYSPKQMETIIWGTISFFTVASFPFMERFEYIGISIWLAYVIPNIMVYLWVCTKGLKENFKLKQKKGIVIASILFVILNSFFESRDLINIVVDSVAKASFILVFVYPYVLYGLSFIRKKEQI
ncbi:GerAB/ArcD/ProY family transporter [Cytobacillus sp. FJAT-54145]|uniref:GerAB/ArcD/ProY family transporter n=1 Tax=Cytobacillus spartinae TaxID=3299023 RepID=A0ABW6KDY4_9BACI